MEEETAKARKRRHFWWKVRFEAWDVISGVAEFVAFLALLALISWLVFGVFFRTTD